MRKIVCECGKKIRVYEKALGKHGKCPRCSKAITISAHIWQNPPEITKIDKYSIIREMSRGNTGIVYEAIDQDEKRYAIKITYSDDIKQKEALEKEYSLLKDISHRNIISYLGIGQEKERTYLLMEFIDGKSLEDLLLTIPGELPIPICLQLIKKMALVLGYIHAHNILHLNFKPANILFTAKYEPVIINFSIAQTIDDNKKDHDSLVGSPRYTAPENKGQGIISPLCDIYSLGCILFELLTGEQAISDENLLQSNVLFNPLPSQIKAHIPPEIDNICAKSLHFDPEKRYSSTSQLIYEIENYLGYESDNLSLRLQTFFHEFQNPFVHEMNSEIFIEKDFARYQIIRLFYKNDWSVLYKAIDTKSNKIVVLRILLSHKNENKNIDFLEHMRTIQKLRYPHLLKILSFGSKPQKFYTAEYIKGSSLSKLIGSYKYKKIATIFYKIAMALHFVHQETIHANLTMESIKLDERLEPKILNLELTSLYEETMFLENEATQISKYSSPERIQKQNIDLRTDIYSLGAILYHILTDRVPFQGKKTSVTEQIVKSKPLSPSLINPEIPKELEYICLKSLEKIPNRRYSSMEWLAFDLKKFIDGEPVCELESPFLTKIRHNLMLILSFIFIILNVTFFIYLGYHNSHVQQEMKKNSDTAHMKWAELKLQNAEDYYHQAKWEKAIVNILNILEKPQQVVLKNKAFHKRAISLLNQSITMSQMLSCHKFSGNIAGFVRSKSDKLKQKIAIATKQQIFIFDTKHNLLAQKKFDADILEFSFFGNTIILALENKKIVSWHYQKQQQDEVAVGNTKNAQKIFFNEIAEFAILLYKDEIKLERLDNQREIASWDVEVEKLVISEQGDTMATSSKGETIFWDIQNQFPKFSFNHPFESCSFSEDSKLCALYISGFVFVYDMETGEKVYKVPLSNVKHMTFSYNKKSLAVLNDQSVFIYSSKFPVCHNIFPSWNAAVLLCAPNDILISIGSKVCVRNINVGYQTVDLGTPLDTFKNSITKKSFSNFVEKNQFKELLEFHDKPKKWLLSSNNKYCVVEENNTIFVWDLQQKKIQSALSRYFPSTSDKMSIKEIRFLESDSFEFSTSLSKEIVQISGIEILNKTENTAELKKMYFEKFEK